MEKFGEKFAADNIGNPNPLNREMSAEALYLVSYATMMLQTSLHNPNAVKSRMTIIDFTKQLKGVNEGKSLDDEFLQCIFDTVEREPFTLNEDEDARMKQDAAAAKTHKQKQEFFMTEGQRLVKRGTNEMSSAQLQQQSKFIEVEGSETI